MFKQLVQLVVILSLSITCSNAFADMTIDASKSSVYFNSIKNGIVGEVHHFQTITGTVNKKGEVQVDITLASAETGIPMRNERLQTLFFNTKAMPIASIKAQIDPATIASLKPGITMNEKVSLVIDLHGETQTYTTSLSLTGLEDGAKMAATTSPILLNLTDFNLLAGVESLRKIAGLNSIATSIPVTATLVFSPSK